MTWSRAARTGSARGSTTAAGNGRLGALPALGLPGVPGHSTSGYQGAFGAFNALAASTGAITANTQMREVWTTAAGPTRSTLIAELTKLQTILAGTGGHREHATYLAPPTYAACTRPRGGTGFTAVDWTWMVNEVFGELRRGAGGRPPHDLKTMRAGLFESREASAPGDRRRPAALRGRGHHRELQPAEHVRGGVRDRRLDRRSPAGRRHGGERGLWVASESLSSCCLRPLRRRPRASRRRTAGCPRARRRPGRDDGARLSQPQQVFGDGGLRNLVGQLRSRGTWVPDTDGMQARAARASYQRYQALLPTLYSRWVVTGCQPTQAAGAGARSSAARCRPETSRQRQQRPQRHLDRAAPRPPVVAERPVATTPTPSSAGIDCDYADA